MKNNKIISLKVYLFKAFRPIEKVLAHNRMRRDRWISIQAKSISDKSKVLDIEQVVARIERNLIIVNILRKILLNYQTLKYKTKKVTAK